MKVCFLEVSKISTQDISQPIENRPTQIFVSFCHATKLRNNDKKTFLEKENSRNATIFQSCSMHSNAIYDSLSHILHSPVIYIALVRHNNDEYFFCVGNHSFFIIDSQLNNVKAEVFYAHVERIILDTSKDKLLLIQLSDNKDSGVPAKLILDTENRYFLVEQLKSAWKTDYMFRLGQVNDLPLFQSVVSAPIKPTSSRKMQIPSYLLDPPQGWRKFEHKKHRFFIPTAFEQQNEKDMTFFYVNQQKKPMAKISIQISEDIPLDALSFMDGKEDISLYCEEYATKLIADEPKWWLFSSKAYIKRNNLNQDIACWQGWEVHLKTPKKDILVTFLRRKFIPPLLDYFVDFVIVVEGAERNIHSIAQPNKIEKQLSDPRLVINYGRKIADSFHAIFTTGTIYEALIKRRVDSLYYDEDTLSYLQYRIPNKIKSTYTMYGVAFVKKISEILEDMEVDPNLLPVDIEEIPRLLKQKYREEQNIDPLFDNRDPFENPPEWRKIQESLESQLIQQRGKDEGEHSANWAFKVSRFLAYCVDGGLLNFYFTLHMLVEIYIKHSKEQTGEKLNEIIVYLLQLRPESEYRMSTPSPLASKIRDMLYSKERYIYNEKVMICLLELGYFRKELGGSDNPLLYSKFLSYMLENSTNPFIKYAICRQIIQDQNEKKSSAVNLDINLTEIKSLVRPILQLYQGNSFRLATLAAITLCSLCFKIREIQQFIMQEGLEVILQQLNPRDEDLLQYTLQLLKYLMSVPQNIQIFLGKGVLKRILEILEGNSTPGVYYSDEVLTLTCQLLIMIVKNVEEYKVWVSEHAKLIMSLFDIPRPDKHMSEALVAEIMNLFLEKLDDTEKARIDAIGESSLESFIKKINEDYFKTHDMQERVLIFLNRLRGSDDNIQKMKQGNIIPKLREWLPEHKKQVNILLKDLESRSGKRN